MIKTEDGEGWKMRWHIGIFAKRKALFFGLAFLALFCVFVMFHEVQGEDG